MGDIKLERVGAGTLLTIDRPQSLNAISRPTMDELNLALDEVVASDTSVLAIRGAGERVFVSGGDLKELAAIQTHEDAQEMAMRMRTLLDRVATLPMPVIAGLNGQAFGGGCETAVACDFRIAADDIKMAFNQVTLAIMPAWGGIERLQALVGRARALYLTTTASLIDAPTAERWGLVEQVVPRADFESTLADLLERMGRVPRDVLVGIKGIHERAQTAARPELAAAATSTFADSWIADEHWAAVEAMNAKRREAAAAKAAAGH